MASPAGSWVFFIVVTPNLCEAAFHHPKVGKKPKGCDRAQNMASYPKESHPAVS